MTKEIATVTQNIPAVTREKIAEYLTAFNLANSLQENEINQFIEIAVSYQLNPFKREIYCIPYKMGDGTRKLSIVTGYEVYLKRAERMGALNGWQVATSGSVKDMSLKAIVTIHRKDWANPLVHEVFFSEYNQGNKLWREKPITMIKKVAIAQAFRMAFPDEFGGMPYTSDELPEEMTKVELKPAETKPEPNPEPAKPEPKQVNTVISSMGAKKQGSRDIYVVTCGKAKYWTTDKPLAEACKALVGKGDVCLTLDGDEVKGVS